MDADVTDQKKLVLFRVIRVYPRLICLLVLMQVAMKKLDNRVPNAAPVRAAAAPVIS